MISRRTPKSSLRILGLGLAVAVLSTSALACDRGEAEQPKSKAEVPKEKEAEPETSEKQGASGEGAAVAGEFVEVAADGTTFDPPVAVEKIPDGAWMCDMGTVHYASKEKGEGKCPSCGMALVEKGAGHDGHAHE